MNKHLTYIDAFAGKGIHIIKPKDGPPKTADGPVTQAETIARNLPDMCDELGCRLVIWDTMTADSVRSVRELAQSGLHSSGKTKTFQVQDDDGVLVRQNSGEWRDYGFVQERMRTVREAVINHPGRNYHFFCGMHQETATKSVGQDKEGNQIKAAIMHGPNAGGPSSVEHWGKEFQWAVHRLYVEKEKGKEAKRYLQVQPDTDRANVPFVARTNTGGAPLKSPIEIPDGLDGCTALWERLLDVTGVDLTNPYDLIDYCLYGIMGTGKTFWLAAFLAAMRKVQPDAGLLYIASDGGSERLRSIPQGLKKGEL